MSAEGGSADDLTARAAARWASRLDVAQNLRANGAGGTETAAALTDLTDGCVRDLAAAARLDLTAADRRRVHVHAAVLATGGYGRAEMAPHSDVDVLLLGPGPAHGPPAEAACEAWCGHLVRRSWDAGLPLAHAAHTRRSAVAAAGADVQTATALLTARPVFPADDGGEAGTGFLSVFLRWARRRGRWLCREALAARNAERAAHGETPFLLEPDVKRAAGGLRDAALLRWVAVSVFGHADVAALAAEGHLSAEDAAAFAAALDELLGVRCDLHLHAGRGRDVFTRGDQLALIPPPGAEPAEARRTVGEFMRGFLTRTGELAELSDRFVSRHRPRSWRTKLKRAVRRPYPGRSDRLTAGPHTLDVPAADRAALAADPRRTLTVFGVAARTGALPSPALADAIRAAVPRWSDAVTPAVAAEFDALLAAGPHAAAAVRSLHRHGVLDWLLPPMAAVRCLTQFNQYHRYTVDEHSLRCVEAACGMLTDRPTPGSDTLAPLGGCDAAVSAARRAVTDPALLTLAVLLHDCGKGTDRDHSEVGAERAYDAAVRLGLSGDRREVLVWLVAHHLKMTHLVLRRDTADPAVIFRFAREVGDVPRLRMLYVLSAADLRGVGPDAWTAWKGDLLGSFHENARRALDGGRPVSEGHADAARRAAAAAYADRSGGSPAGRAAALDWAADKLRHFSPHLVAQRSPDRLAEDLAALRDLPPGGAAADGNFDPETGATEYRLAAAAASPGLFARLAGVLAARRLDVVDAVVESLDDGGVLDLFRVVDRDFLPPAPTPIPGHPISAATAAVPLVVPDWRLRRVADALREAATAELSPETPAAEPAAVSAAIAASRPFGEDRPAPLPAAEPSRVTCENTSSDTCTVLDVFAADAPGLMFALATALAELGLRVRLAKISTHLDQVVDVFYVTDLAGGKVRDAERLETIRRTLLDRVRAFEM